jgi:C1A family cysteine protease
MRFNRPLSAIVLGALALSVSACGVNPVFPGLAAGTGIAARKVASEFRVGGFDLDRAAMQESWAPVRHLPRATIPAKFDLMQNEAPIYDQGKLGSCTAFAIAKGLRESLQRKNGETPTPLSALFFYYAERELRGSVNQDSGATITDGMQVLSKTGCAPDSAWAYDITKFAVRPPQEAYDGAGAWKLKEKPVKIGGLDDLKQAIAKGSPVSFGFMVFESIRKVGADGIIPVPSITQDKLLGGHAVTAVGYDDETQLVKIRNSWGTERADKGYYYMPYGYFKKAMMVRDYWTAVR